MAVSAAMCAILATRCFVRLGWFVLLACLIFLCFSAPSARSEDNHSKLSAYELKFFQHDYSQEPVSTRLDRLEKLVFGEIKQGSDAQRLTALSATVSVSESEQPPSSTASSAKAASETRVSPAGAQSDKFQQANVESKPDLSNYPAAGAIELKLFGKDFVSEPINKRLDRLETRVFGRPSNSSDLSERMDKIKQATGIDVARQVPGSSGWEDDDDITIPGTTLPFTGNAEDAGAEPGSNLGITAGQGMGLNQQVNALESQIFGKHYHKDTLPARVGRLEAIVFPGSRAPGDKTLPDRVAALVAAVPISDSQNDPAAMQQAAHSKGKLSKILNSMGNVFGGGSYPGSYSSGTLIADPQTGLLYDRMTGSLVDPATGVVVGQRGLQGYGNYGTPLGGLGSFNSGFSSFGGTPYGYGTGSGLRFGFGGIGRYGGMWP